jgi:hypothetical protein
MREINISQQEVAALKAYKLTLKEMADRYEISTKDMRNVLVAFGFAKPIAGTVDYVITPVFDMNITKVDNLQNVVNDVLNDEPATLEYNDSVDAFTEMNG